MDKLYLQWLKASNIRNPTSKRIEPTTDVELFAITFARGSPPRNKMKIKIL